VVQGGRGPLPGNPNRGPRGPWGGRPGSGGQEGRESDRPHGPDDGRHLRGWVEG
jgi:hypothetical protein